MGSIVIWKPTHTSARWLLAASGLLAAGPAVPESAPGTAPAVSVQTIALATTEANEWLPYPKQVIAPLADGGYGVVWTEGDWPNQGLRMQWLGSDGEPRFQPPGIAVGVGRENLRSGSIVGCPTGGAFVVVEETPSVGRSVYVQRYDKRGKRRWPLGGLPVQPASNRQTPREPTLVPDGVGGLYVCHETCCLRDAIRCQRFDSTGRSLWGESGVAVGDLSRQAKPAAIPDDAGGLLVFWRDRVRDLGGRRREVNLYGQNLSSLGARLWGDRPVHVRRIQFRSNGAYDDRFFDVVADGGGGAVLAFEDKFDRQGLWEDIGAQRLDRRGRPLWRPVAEVAGGGKFWHLEATIGDGQGGFWVVARRTRGSGSRLFLFRLGADGRHSWRSRGRLLSRRENNRQGNFLAFGALLGDAVWLGWTEVVIRSRTGYSTLDLKLGRYSRDGTRLDPQGGIVITETGSRFLRALAPAATGESILLVWQDRTKGNRDGDLFATLVRPVP